MNVEFATCNRRTAFEYLKKVYPTTELTESMASKLLDLVEKDIVRIRDPFMYGNRVAVIAGTNYKPDHKPLVDEAVNQLKENKLL